MSAPTDPRAFPLLAIDIGNTSTVLGLTGQDLQLTHTWRIRTNRDQLPDDLALSLGGLLALAGAQRPRSAAISNVAPPLGQNYLLALEQHFGVDAFVVSLQNLPEVSVELTEPGNVGADRLCNLFGAERYLTGSEYAVVVDFGTSTNFDVIGRGRRFIGGVLATGAQVLRRRAVCPRRRPCRASICRLRSVPSARTPFTPCNRGLVFGYAEMVDGLLRRIRSELPGRAVTIATGGLCPHGGRHLHPD